MHIIARRHSEKKIEKEAIASHQVVGQCKQSAIWVPQNIANHVEQTSRNFTYHQIIYIRSPIYDKKGCD